MKDILNFLAQLRENNNKQWFDIHRDEYKVIKARIETLTEQLISKISQWDSSIKGLQTKDCLYRINCDIRFSKNKLPYKSHIGIFISKGGKKAGYGGYYLHIEPCEDSEKGFHFLASGTYMLESKYMKVIREDLYADYDYFNKILKKAKSYNLEAGSALKKVPRGFESGTQCDELLKLKNYCLIRNLEQKELLNPEILSNKGEDIIANGALSTFIANEFRPTCDFLNFINQIGRAHV